METQIYKTKLLIAQKSLLGYSTARHIHEWRKRTVIARPLSI